MTDQEPTCLQFIVSAVVTVGVPAVWLWLGDPGGVLRLVLLILLVLSVGGLIFWIGWIVLYGVMGVIVDRVESDTVGRWGVGGWLLIGWLLGLLVLGLLGGVLWRVLT